MKQKIYDFLNEKAMFFL